MRTALMNLLSLALILLTVSCAPIKIKDMTFYGDKGKFGATSVHSLHKQIPPETISKADWDLMRIGMVCTAGENISYALATIDKLCTQRKGACTYEEMREALARIEGATRLDKPLDFFVESSGVVIGPELDLRE